MTAVKWVQIEWCDEAATTLQPAFAGDEIAIKLDVERGFATLWHVPEHGYIVTRLEDIEPGVQELVLVAWAGQNTGPIVEHAQNVCQSKGIQSIRFHTHHPEKLINRFVKRWGFGRVQTVYRWES
ncbi:hypothetical protein [Aliamphritea ceti]|uniref:hypothetical protein n=1 Tax=Aliamphritea ceti TaxID=1524258 RepID=UPI0021C3585A|nr:hypothetical protein [Aliamphritea ceti]